jgi:hypothetical protein
MPFQRKIVAFSQPICLQQQKLKVIINASACQLTKYVLEGSQDLLELYSIAFRTNQDHEIP